MSQWLSFDFSIVLYCYVLLTAGKVLHYFFLICLYFISILVEHPDDGLKRDRKNICYRIFYQCAFVGSLHQCKQEYGMY